jgi:hypothetical protein
MTQSRKFANADRWASPGRAIAAFQCSVWAGAVKWLANQFAGLHGAGAGADVS